MNHFVQNDLRGKLAKLASERSNIEAEVKRLKPGEEKVIFC